jgi:hypothetical protein
MALRDLAMGFEGNLSSARALAATSLEDVDRILATQSRFAMSRATEAERRAELAKVDRLLDRRLRLMRGGV